MEAATLINRTPSSLRSPDLLATFQGMADFDKAAGARLRKARERLNLSQFDAGHALGVTDKTVGKWEKAISAPRARNWKKIEEVYGVTVEEIRGEPEPAQLDRIEAMLRDLLASIAPPAAEDGAQTPRRLKLERPSEDTPRSRKRGSGS